MSTSTLIYAGYEYYQLTYTNTTHNLTKVQDKFNILQTIVPKAMWSRGYSNYIIDINNNINCVIVNHNDFSIVDTLILNLGKATLNKFTIVICQNNTISHTSCYSILLKNDTFASYEYLEITIENKTVKSFNRSILNNNDVAQNSMYYTCKLNDGPVKYI